MRRLQSYDAECTWVFCGYSLNVVSGCTGHILLLNKCLIYHSDSMLRDLNCKRCGLRPMNSDMDYPVTLAERGF